MSDIKIEPRASTSVWESQPLSSSVEQQISEPSTSYTVLPPVQGGIEQSQFPNVRIRKSIKEHLNLHPRLNEAATAVLLNREDIADSALKHNLDFWILERKVQILKRTNNYLRIQFPHAIHYYLHNANIHDLNVQEKLIITAKKFDIGTEFKEHLKDEVQRFSNLYLHYTYKKITISYEVFTSFEEEKILEQLYQWKEVNAPCHCIICVMEHLLSLAYKFAKEEKIPYPSIWKFNKADELWLLEFHMRNSEEMVRRFPPASSCTKEPPASTCAWESSSLLEQQEISEPSTSSYAHQPKRPKLSQDSNVRKSDIQTRIKRHLEISDQLDKAAKKVLEEYKDIARVAREYQLNPWILKQKVDIIELRKKQFFWKCKVEPAVHAVRFNILSVCDAAKEYKVEESDIHNRLKQLKNPKSCIYLHETIKTDDKVLSCEEEFLLLKKLEAEVNDDRNRNCGCRTCSLQILRHLAYQFAVENKKQYPSAWNNNKVADEVWLLQFEMRHSIEISEYFDMNV